MLGLLDDIRPDTVVTFGPDGMTGHPDHIALSHWVSAAWASAVVGSALQATTTASFADRFASVHEALGVFPPACRYALPDDELAVAVHLDAELQDVKLASLRLHASQLAPVIDAIGLDCLRRWWSTEMFVEER